MDDARGTFLSLTADFRLRCYQARWGAFSRRGEMAKGTSRKLGGILTPE